MATISRLHLSFFIHMSTSICGLDEAGRGALAGPLVAAAVILKESVDTITSKACAPLRDSKTLSTRQREAMYDVLINSPSTVICMNISAQLINEKGIGWANKEIFRMLICQIPATEYIVDGNLSLAPIPGIKGTVRCLVDADATEAAVICAGIVAKVTRDRMMQELHAKHPYFGWDHNAGYGTREHIAMIREHGSTLEHRTVYVNTALEKFR